MTSYSNSAETSASLRLRGWEILAKRDRYNSRLSQPQSRGEAEFNAEKINEHMKLRLNVDELNDDFFEETRLLGITAPVKNYQFCLQLNNQLGYDFRLNADIEIHLRKKDRSYYFSVYQSNEPNSFLTHYLYHNQFDGEYLLPEFKHMDFLWLMKGDLVDEEKCDWIKQAVKSLSGVQLVAELTNEQIKNKGNMVF